MGLHTAAHPQRAEPPSELACAFPLATCYLLLATCHLLATCYSLVYLPCKLLPLLPGRVPKKSRLDQYVIEQ